VTSCPEDDALIALVDEQLPEGDAAARREHVARCTSCQKRVGSFRSLARALGERVPPSPGALDRLAARLESLPARPPRRALPPVAWAVVGAVTAAAMWVVVPRLAHRDDFEARGTAGERSLSRDVGVSLYGQRATLIPLLDGDTAPADTPFAVSYRNLGSSGFLMVFAKDARSDVHWIAPAYLDASTDPPSVPLAHHDTDALLSRATILDGPADGPLTVFVVITPRPHRVTEVEGLGKKLDAALLRAAWPDAEVRELHLTIERKRP